MRTYLIAELRRLIDELSIDYLVCLLSKTGSQLQYAFKQPSKEQFQAACRVERGEA